MKTFSKFLKEAGQIKSIAALQGRRLGLVPDGHGGYHDKKTGEFIAKSSNGKLKFYNQNQVIGAPVATQTFRKKAKANKESIELRDRQR